jgi:cytidylate kinase
MRGAAAAAVKAIQALILLLGGWPGSSARKGVLSRPENAKGLIDMLRGMSRLGSYLGSYSRGRESGPALPLPFVTISREAGAGGQSTATALMEELESKHLPIYSNWKLCDKEVCEEVIKNPALSAALEDIINEKYRGPLEDFVSQLLTGHSPQDMILYKLRAAVRKIAALGKVIIVGRGGAVAAQGLPAGVNIRVTAPRAQRIDRLMEQLALPREAAEARMDELDTARRKLFLDAFSVDINDPRMYDATFDSSQVSFKEIAKSTIVLIEEKLAELKADPALYAEELAH